jgi:ATP-dependent RNA helicase DeaD
VSEALPRFDALPLRPETQRALREMAFETATPVQAATLELIFEGRDLMVQAQTGTGKTAAFGIPLVDRIVTTKPMVQALVLEPTRELALQVASEIARIAQHADLRVSAVYGGAAMGRQVAELREGAQIVAGTPGRVLDHLRRGTFAPKGLKALVLDEADHMLSMGFAEEINAILDRLPKLRQTMLFSATIPDDIQRLALRHMRSPMLLALSSDRIGAEAIRHFFYLVPANRSREDALLSIIEVENPESAIVFCNTRDDTNRVAGALQRAGYAADWLNADLAQGDREAVLARTREGKLRFLVATDVAARGIDISHLTHVVNFGFPESAEGYVHRTGRTGRMGRMGTAISLIGPTDVGNLYYLRLQYKIDPIERRLPSEEEKRTEEEVRRWQSLAARFPGTAPESARSLVRRILTRIEGEDLLASIVAKELTLEVAAPTPLPSAPAPSPRAPAPPPPVQDDEGRPRRRRRTRAAIAPEPTGGGSEVEFWERYRPPAVEDVPSGSAAEKAPEPEPEAPRPEPEAPRPEPTPSDRVTLYVNVGKRDGLRRADLDRLLETAGVDLTRVLDVRLLDRHTFVDISGTDVDSILARLGEQQVGKRKVVAERARARA